LNLLPFQHVRLKERYKPLLPGATLHRAGNITQSCSTPHSKASAVVYSIMLTCRACAMQPLAYGLRIAQPFRRERARCSSCPGRNIEAREGSCSGSHFTTKYQTK